ncbi:MAG: AAA family ATPase [Vulcanimicrobiota bacterium]
MKQEKIEIKDEIIKKVFNNLTTVIKGKEESINDLLIALLAGVNVLIEDVPGVGKTTLAKGLAKSIRGEFRRVQFTPDLLPADIVGSSIYNPKEGTFYFNEGPIFTNILLADEINRASPRTQSSLLEAMSEKQVTVDGVSNSLSSFFMVIATQNSVEFHGTYPLPEAQLDRFGIKICMGYPDTEFELEIFDSQSMRHPLEDLESVASIEEIIKLQEKVKRVKVNPPVARYIVDIANASRLSPELKIGISPRGNLVLYRVIQARALMAGRDFATPDDIKIMASKVLAHRLVLETKTKYSGTSREQIINNILKELPVPT